MGPQMTIAQFHSRRSPEEPGAEAAERLPGEERPPASTGRIAWHSILTGGVVGALSGGLAAIGALFAYTYLNPAVDQRVEPLAQKLASLGTGVEQLSTSVGTMQAELARMLGLESTVLQRLASQDDSIASLEARAGEVSSRDAATTGVGSPLFGIAVLQLRAAFLSGRPFEPELVSVYELAGTDPQVSPRLQTLTGPSRMGVSTLADLRRQLASHAEAAGIHPMLSDSYYGYGMSLVSKFVGYSGEPYEVEAARHAVWQADALLEKGEVAGAIERLGDLSGSQAEQLEPWLEAARQRLAAESAIAGLTDLVVASLKEKLAASAPE